MEEIRNGDTVWRFERDFLESNWTCIWGRGCLGILDEPTPHRNEGCCSLGADLDGHDEARTLSALAAMIDPDRFQHHREATPAGGGIFADVANRTATRVVDGACIFLNRRGFAGGEGCALHLEALAQDESPIDWKPSVCWQLPIHVDYEDGDDETEVATVRRWSRADWGREGETMAWCCTEGDLAYVGERPVVESLAEELTALVGTEVFVELRRRLANPPR